MTRAAWTLAWALLLLLACACSWVPGGVLVGWPWLVRCARGVREGR